MELVTPYNQVKYDACRPLNAVYCKCLLRSVNKQNIFLGTAPKFKKPCTAHIPLTHCQNYSGVMSKGLAVMLCIREAHIKIVAYRVANLPPILRDISGPIPANAVTLYSRPHKPLHVYHLRL